MGRRTGSGNGGQSVGASGLRNGVFTGVGVRPIGFQFPVGLNVTVAANNTVDYLVVAGGGGGGGNFYGGGGGAGGYLEGTGQSLSVSTNYTVTVGSGGPAGPSGTTGSNGNDSSISGPGISTVTSTGGGGGSKAASRRGSPTKAWCMSTAAAIRW